MDVSELVQKKLFEMQDLKYRDFQARLMPNIDPDTIIGVRTPLLRSFAKAFSESEDAAVFLQILPHGYYEENNLHSFLIERIRDFDKAVAAVDAFLPYVDNWATCDSMSPKVFGKNLDALYGKCEGWIASGKTYTVRFGVEMLMRWFLDADFKNEAFGLVSGVRSEEYYVRMMVAWYFATALAKRYDAALPILTEHRLDRWTHNKAIQKAIESYRITDAQKAYLRTLKIK